MNNTGYALLSKDQLHLLYGPQSPYNNSQALGRLVGMNSSAVHAGMEQDVHALAELDAFRERKKDVVLSPILFTNFILTFSVKNPTILSPILFSSLILSPNVLVLSSFLRGCLCRSFCRHDCWDHAESVCVVAVHFVPASVYARHSVANCFVAVHSEPEHGQPDNSVAFCADAVHSVATISFGPHSLTVRPFSGHPQSIDRRFCDFLAKLANK